jgi:surface protein
MRTDSFNQDISGWDVSSVVNMGAMFREAQSFNQGISNWDVSNVYSMSTMFLGAASFNQDLSDWCVLNIPSVPSLFAGSSSLDSSHFPLWGTCGGAFVNDRSCIECDSLSIGDFFVYYGDSIEVVDRVRLDQIIAAQGDLTKVCVSHVTNMKNLLRGQSWFNQDIGNWDVSNVTNMNRMFKKASAFDQDISNWEVGNVNRMTQMFESATLFNQDLSNWCVKAFQYNPPSNFALNAALITAHYPRWGNCPQEFTGITNLASGAFINSNGCIDCSALNIGDYFELNGDTLLVVDRAMLDSLVLLHDDLSKICVSNITDMTDALRGLIWFNTNISNWDVSNVTDMSNMFWKARTFNQDIGNWDVRNVTRMNRLFKVAKSFNQDIGGWDVSSVQRFQEMFRNADAFNQDIGSWDVSSVLDGVQMQSMFRGADYFSQDLSMWCVSNVTSRPSGFDANSSLTASQLPQWGTCPSPGSMVGNDNPIASQYAKGDNAAKPAKTPQVAVFPNPTTGMVKISPVIEGTYRIYNEVGRTIGEGQIKEAYDFSTQPSGIYMLMLQTENGTQYLKVVKQ